MLRKMLTVCFAALLLCCLLGTALAAGPSIVDNADLFTPAEEAHLSELIEKFRADTKMDFVIYTSQEPHNSSLAEIADDFYDYGGYGLGDNHSGILYYIDMYKRTPYLSTTGDMIGHMSDDHINDAHEASYSALANGNYAAAAEKMISSVLHYVKKTITPGEFALSAVIAAAVALLFMGKVKGSYNLSGSTYEYDFRNNGKVALTREEDDFLRTTSTRTRKSPPPSSGGSGSSTHTSSSGRSHGGGAGRSF